MNKVLQELIDVCNKTNSKVVSYGYSAILGDIHKATIEDENKVRYIVEYEDGQWVIA